MGGGLAHLRSPRVAFFSQLHSSLNGGSLEQGGIDGRMAPAPPLAVDTLRDP